MAGLKTLLMIWVPLWANTNSVYINRRDQQSPRVSLHQTVWSKFQLKFYSENNCRHTQNVLIQLHCCSALLRSQTLQFKQKMMVLKSYTDFSSIWKPQEVKNGLKKAANLRTFSPKTTLHYTSTEVSTTMLKTQAKLSSQHWGQLCSTATNQLFESSLQNNRK